MRLAQRQNVRVSLQPSPYGGTTAVVFIPAALLTDAPDTNGTGFRLDRKAAHGDAAGRRERDAGPRALSPLPVGIPDRALLDGPVELEAPVDPLEPSAPHALDDDRSVFLGGTPRGVPAERWQHQQSADEGAGAPAQPSGPVPLPRRRPPAPTLVSDHGRRVDDQAYRDHPSSAEPVRPAGLSPERRRADALRASGLVPAPAPEPRRPAHARESADGTGVQGALPRRVRQASLAPQLKETSAEPRTAPGRAARALSRSPSATQRKCATVWRRCSVAGSAGVGTTR